MAERGGTTILDNLLDNQISYSEATRNLKPLPQAEKIALDKLNSSCIIYSKNEKGKAIVEISKSSVEELKARTSKLRSHGYDVVAYLNCIEDYDYAVKNSLFKAV